MVHYIFEDFILNKINKITNPALISEQQNLILCNEIKIGGSLELFFERIISP